MIVSHSNLGDNYQDAKGIVLQGGYGITDAIDARLAYVFCLENNYDGEGSSDSCEIGKGVLGVNLGLSLLDNATTDLAIVPSFSLNIDTPDNYRSTLGVRFRHKISNHAALYVDSPVFATETASEDDGMGGTSTTTAYQFGLPLGLGAQFTPKLFAGIQTRLFSVTKFEGLDAEEALIFKNGFPILIAANYALSPSFEIGLQLEEPSSFGSLTQISLRGYF